MALRLVLVEHFKRLRGGSCASARVIPAGLELFGATISSVSSREATQDRTPDAQEHVCFACVPPTERICYTCPKLMDVNAVESVCPALKQDPSRLCPDAQAMPCPFEEKGCLQSDCPLPCLAQDYQI
eukprot:jgi/Botrbrau1/1652/Bobra.0185s0062.1